MARAGTVQKKRSRTKTAGPDRIEMFGKRLGASKKLMVAFAIDPWSVAAMNGVPSQYIAALRQYEEKLLRISVKQLNVAVDTKGVHPLSVARKPPISTRTLASERGWELRFVKVERTVLGKRVLLGYKLVLNDKLCKDIVNGIAAGQAFIGFIQAVATAAALSGGTLAPILAAAALIAAALMLQAALITLMNRGNGVNYFTSYWIILNIAAFGPAGLVNAWVGPLPN